MQKLAYEIYESLDNLSTGWAQDERYQALDYWSRVKVDRIINNIIREDYY